MQTRDAPGPWPSAPCRRLSCGRLGRSLILTALITVSALSLSATVAPGKNVMALRGKQIEIHFRAAAASAPKPAPKILYAPGDGGWRGFAITMAETMAAWGYDVYALDTRVYLEAFTTKTATLHEAEIMSDFREIARWIAPASGERILLVGWSEGAGLELLAAAADDNKNVFSGLVTIGLDEYSVLGWRTADYITWVTKKQPNEPTFRSEPYMPKVSPLPLAMLDSTHDEFISAEATRKLFSLAREPKRLNLVEAQNHRFDGNRPGFFTQLQQALEWVGQNAPRQTR